MKEREKLSQVYFIIQISRNPSTNFALKQGMPYCTRKNYHDDDEVETNEYTCDNCGSVRLSLISVIEQIAGKNWRDNFEPNPDPLTPDHPEVKRAEALGRKLIARMRGEQ